MDKLEMLKGFFGHTGFRTGQEELVDALLAGRDVLGVMPTGAGKSICYQLPALMLPGMALVVSPLISLMKDQVAALVQAGAPAGYINSSLTPGQCAEALRRAARGVYKLLYIAPERLLLPEILQLARQAEISLLAVDEAHCVSQWGQDFRPSYLQISQFVEQLPRRPAVGAFTATATAQVKEDMEKLLELRAPLRVTTGFDRPNLFFEVVRPKSKDRYLREFLSARQEQSGIVYCATRKLVESVCQGLNQQGVAATRYHAGLSDQERRQNQEDFVFDRARVMVATNAFGMGIDKSNVSFVVHYNMPKNMESYYQEAGRAGRDGEPAHCVLLFAPGDVRTARFLIDNASDNEALSEEEREQVRRQDLQRLERMTSYCCATGCLRAFLLSYFGEEAPASCGGCGNCVSELETRDLTVEAQKILSGVARVEKKYRKGLGESLILRMLRGSKDQRVRELGLDSLSTYGIMGDVSREQLRDYIDFLIEKEYLRLDGEEFPVVRLGSRARGVLFQGEPVRYARRKPDRAEKMQSSGGNAPLEGEQGELYEALRALRNRLAAEAEVPGYIVFSNAVLAALARSQPENMDQLRDVQGIGERKSQRYGKAFLEEIAAWKQGREQE